MIFRPDRESQGKAFAATDEKFASFESVFRSDLFAGHRVMVTGGGSGIGKHIAALFARHGATVAICGRSIEKLEATAELLERLSGKKSFFRPLSIRDPDEAEAFIQDAAADMGGLDTLVNNAGGQYAQDAIDLSRKGWQAVIDLNLNGTWWMMQEAAKFWRGSSTQGNIVNIACTVERGCPQMAHTCASRAGVIYLSKTLAVEWAPLGIRVNSVAVGATLSEGFGNYDQAQLFNFERSNTQQRSADPMEIAQAVAYLASPAAAFITGSLFTVDGGQAQWGETWLAGRPEYFAPQTSE